jgi:endonuclease YncB( thermonuclease family)
MRRMVPVLAAIGMLAAACAARADLTGRAVGITDGDTFTLLVPGNQQVRIRLAEIDTPESDESYGSAHSKFSQPLSSASPSGSVCAMSTATGAPSSESMRRRSTLMQR